MKPKPISHKNENTFKFQSFNERVSEINIDVIHRVGKTSEVPDGTETFFLETLEKWNDLNYSEDFDELKREIGFDIQTLLQLVHRQNEILDILERNLTNPKSRAIDATFELLVSLARDLQSDFYPHFPRFFGLLVNLLYQHDPALLEMVFKSLAYLFKFLWRYMIKDIEDVYRLYSPLLRKKHKEHIRHFAAESFAFLMRKVPDRERLFLIIFKTLSENPDQAQGVGQLLFEIVKGVRNQLHSCSESVLTLLFKMLGTGLGFENNDAFNINLVMEATLQMDASICHHIKKEFTSGVWKVLKETLESLLMERKMDSIDETVDNHILNILTIAYPFVEFKSGILVEKPESIMKVFIELIQSPNQSDDCGVKLLEISACLMSSKNAYLGIDSTKLFINCVYSSKLHSTVILDFTEQLFEYKRFDEDVLSNAVTYFENLLNAGHSGPEILTVLVNYIIHKNGSLFSAENLQDNQSLFQLDNYQLQYLNEIAPNRKSKTKSDRIKNEKELSVLRHEALKLLKDEHFDAASSTQLSYIWLALMALPHFDSLEDNLALDLMLNTTKKLNSFLISNESISENWEKCAFVFNYAVAAISQTDDKIFIRNFEPEFFYSALSQSPKSLSLLCAMDIYLNQLNKNESSKIEIEFVEKLTALLLPNLSSPFHKVRLLTLRVLTALPFLLPTSEDNDENVERNNIFEICLAAEEIPITLHDVRKKLIILQKLNHNEAKKYIPIGNYELAPLYYLVGMLYVNFTLLWKPVQEHIESHARVLGSTFWDFIFPHLTNIAEDCENVLSSAFSSNPKNTKSGLEFEPSVLSAEHVFNKELFDLGNHVDSPDLVNHRHLMWKCLENMSDLAETKNREIVNLYLKFLKNEFYVVDSSLCQTENITKSRHVARHNVDNRKLNLTQNGRFQRHKFANKFNKTFRDKKWLNKIEIKNEVDIVTDETLLEEEQTEDLNKTDEIVEPVLPRRKATVKTLAAHLAVFAKFTNPKALYKESELYKIYLDLLTNKDDTIQKLAFDCILSYNHKFLTPYKTNFQNLLDDKTFKTEIVLFSVDSQTSLIQKEHRANLLPLLMRILYGKMLSKTGSKTSGKSHSEFRRAIVLRFLAGCRVDELKIFLELVFGDYMKSSHLGAVENIKHLQKTTNPNAVIPIRKQLSTLNTLSTVFNQLGSLAQPFLPWLLEVLLSLLTISTTLLEQRENIHNSFINPLKAMRTQAVYRLIQFFQSFDHYPYSEEEIDAIFEAAVWPILPRLEHESLLSPTPLLKLFSSWSENPRFFILLGKYYPGNLCLCPVNCLLNLYTSNKIQQGVVYFVSRILQNLLTLKDHSDNEENDDEVPKGSILSANYARKLEMIDDNWKGEPPNYGTLLLIPYVSRILERLELQAIKVVKSPKKTLSGLDLSILSRMSEHVKDEDQCTRLISLLIPFLSKPIRRNLDMETETLVCIKNLMKWASNPSQFVRGLSSLFSTLFYRNSRMALCQVIAEIASRDSKFVKLNDIVKKMNSWNPRVMDEPDFNSRLDGFELANKRIKEMENEIDCDFILTIIYNCTFNVRTSDDPSLQDCATFSLQQMTFKFAEMMENQQESFRLLAIDTFLTEIEKGLKNKNENVRHEFIKILTSLLQNCGKHPRLSNLSKLCNEDPEVDFWINIKHIQLHRRARVMRRLIVDINNGDLKFPHYVYSNYLLPIASAFLFDNSYVKHSNLIDAAVDFIGAACSSLPWNRYEALLKYYLNQLTKNMEFHKVIIKVIVSVLNNFKFDLSKARNVNSNLTETRFKKKQYPFEPVSVPEAKVNSEETVKVEEIKKDIEADESETLELFQDLPMDDETIVETEEDKNAEFVLEEKASKIFSAVIKQILPRLENCLAKKSRSDGEHKMSNKKFPEDEEILRIPLAIAMVKLLQNLPHNVLQLNLPGIFLKVVHFLKSRAESIREASRETLVKMMQSLGPHYLWFLLKEMKGVLKRGYQLHVLIYTVHTILSSLLIKLKPGDLDSCIETLSKLCLEELFGEVSEEKEVEKITGKWKEAKGSKSYNTYQLLGQFVSESHLTLLILPLKEVLSTTHNHKVVTKVQNCLKQIVFGLSTNESLSSKSLLIFAHGVMANSTVESFPVKKPAIPVEEQKFIRPDIYLIAAEPKRGGKLAKTSIKTNAYLLTEFSLQLLYFCLKRERVTSSNEEHLNMLDPYVEPLSDALNSQHIKVIATSLRCLAWLVKFPLPSLKDYIEIIVGNCFTLLNKYCGAGMGQGDNFEMVVMCFKLLTVVVRDLNYHKITDDQVRILLVYIEQDIHDHTRQSTAFTILKAILSRKLDVSELRPIMTKVAEMSVTSEQEHIRAQCRQSFLQYLLEYRLGKQLDRHLNFFVVQLEYEYESGRESAIEMLNTLFTTFPISSLSKRAGLFMVPLSARLVNDSSPKLKQMAAAAIKNLITKVQGDTRSNLFNVVLSWLQEKNKFAHKRLGAQLCGLFVDVEKDLFASRLKDVLPLLEQILVPEKYENMTYEGGDRKADHLTFHSLTLFMKILTSCGFKSVNLINNALVSKIFEYIQKYLLHPHNWVRLVSAQLFGLLFANYTTQELIKSIKRSKKNISQDFILKDTKLKLQQLSSKFCSQLRSIPLTEAHSEQIVRNLVYLAKIIRCLPDNQSQTKIDDKSDEENNVISKSDDDEEDNDNVKISVSFNWMLRRMSREAKAEVVLDPKNVVKRSLVFKWFAAVSLDMKKEEIVANLPVYLSLLCRELTDQSSYIDPELKKLAQEVVDLLKSIVGVEVFTREYVKAQTEITSKRAKRKADKAIEAVNHPEANARKKIKRQLAKQEGKKRKMDAQSGRTTKRKGKLSDIAMSQ